MSASGSVVRVQRLHSEYLIASNQPDAARIRARLDAVAANGLKQALARVMAPLAANGDPGVWLIRTLEVPIVINAQWEPEQIARTWAAAMCHELARDMSGAGDAANVLSFPDRAAYLARFMRDLATGQAWGQWYYRMFAGLSALPASAALRTLIAGSPVDGLAALQRLTDQQLVRVCAALSPIDARRVLAVLADDDAADRLATWLRAAWANWRALHGALAGLDAAQAEVALCVRGATAGQPAARGLLAANEALIRMAQALRQRPSLAQYGLQSLRAIAAGDARIMSVLAQCPQDLFADIASTLAPRDGTAWSAAVPRTTPYGGAFMLMPALDRLPLQLADAWPPLGETAAPQLLRLLVLAKCLGPAGTAGAFGDPLLRDLLGIAPHIGWPQVRAWFRQLGPSRLDALARVLGLAACDAAITRLSVRYRGRPVVVRIDADGVWRAAAVDAMPAGGAPEIGADLHYFGFAARHRLGAGWDLLLSVAAQQVMRRFAARLHGFSRSRPAYLYRNFLDVAARVETETGRCLVCLARPALELPLNLAGANRQQYQLHWLGAQTYCLCSEE